MFPADQRELIEAVNRTSAPSVTGRLDQHFAAVAERNPDRTAVVSPGRTLAYGDLQAEVSALAGRLADVGVGAGDRVILCAEHGWEQVVAALAVMRVGAAYLPLPPDAPPDHRQAALEQSEARVVITQNSLAGWLAWPAETVVVPLIAEICCAAFEPPATDDDSAAVLPCGTEPGADAAISHRVLCDTVTDVNRRLHLGPEDRVLALVSADSGPALYETFGPLLVGAAVVVGAEDARQSPQEWLKLSRSERVTVWMLTPALLDLLLEHLSVAGESLPRSLRAVVLSGGPLSAGQLGELRAERADLTLAYATAISSHGPWVAWQDLTEPLTSWDWLPIGRPMTNQRLYVLSEKLAPCPVWVPGRLYLGGSAAEPPVESTVRHPETGERLVRTSLFGRLRPEGVVEVTGDESSRVMLHGRPLNLRDVELALGTHEAVRQSAVVAAGSVAYVRVRAGASVTEADLTGHLRRTVSAYLLPERIELVATMPLSSDGLIDRAALGAAARSLSPLDLPPGQHSPEDDELLRRATAVAWRLFDLPDIQPDTNLLDIGANSFQLVRLAIALEEELGLSVSVEDLLRSPTIAAGLRGHLGVTGEPGLGRRSPVPAGGIESAGGAAEGVISGVLAQQAFKQARHGIRHDLDDIRGRQLSTAEGRPMLRRNTTRSFGPDPVSFQALSTLLSVAGVTMQDGEPRYRYASAGSAYPVQVYVLVGPGRVSSLRAGSYYYHPVRDCLVPVAPDATLPISAHIDVNQQAARSSAFSIFLIGRTAAIAPLYGDIGWQFTVLEAGAIAQLFTDAALECGLGLCPIGTMDVAPLPTLLDLDGTDRFVHAILGGLPARGQR